MKTWQRLAWTLVALACLSLTSGVFAQDQQDQNVGNVPPNGPTTSQADAGTNPANDPPARVARIQYISGEVSMQPGGVNDWVAAGLNRPLTTSDRVWTDKDSKAELNVGTAFIRMNSESSVTLTNVSDNTVQVQLDQGTLELTVRHLEPGEVFEIDTPNMAFTVMKSGVYRIDVPANDNQTWVTVRKGNGEATGQGPAVKVNSGEQIRFTGQGSLQHVAYAAPAPDGFEDWAQVRDKRLDGSVSARYVAPGVIGYEDLDYYGTWRTVPTYGAIWVPSNVAAGWAPYRYGHWAWINPWGWTWVDDAPWGFAPFHYGRWVSYGGFWGWAPGPVYVGWRPYYAPALVGWIGGGGWGFGISIGFGGGCGWFPLGWGEAYYPGYHGYRGGYVSNNYIRNVNVTNTHITNITNVTNNYYHNAVQGTHYANRSVAGAVTAAPASALANGQNIAHVGKAVPPSEAGKGQVVRNIDVTPTKQAMLGVRTPTSAGVPPRTATDRPVVTRNTPPAQSVTRTADAHNVPAAPATLGVHNPNNAEVNQTRTAPTASPRNGGAATEANANYPNQAGSTQHVVPKPPSAGGQPPRVEAHGTTATSSAAPVAAAQPAAHNPVAPQPAAHNEVPKPPYASGHAPSSVTSAERSSSPSSQPVHPAATTRAPAPQAAPAATHSQKPSQPTHENAPKSSNPGMASASTPRPASGYNYQPATAYTAHSYAGNSSYGGSSRSYSPSAAPYAANRGSYAAAAPSYHAAPSYSPHVNAPATPSYSSHMSAPAAPHYSAPSYSASGGGGGHSNSSGGGGASHHR